MATKLKSLLVITLLSLIPTFLIWLPFYLRIPQFWNIPLPQNGMATIISNYDGPLYIVVAKTFYNVDSIVRNYALSLPAEYYAAHFPLFPALIRLFSYVLGYPYSMLFVTLASSVLAIYFFNKLIKQYLNGNAAIVATITFALFPARWLIVRSVGSTEPLFVATLIASVYYFKNQKYWWAGIWGALAQLTKSPGILLFVSYVLILVAPQIRNLTKMNPWKWLKSLNWKAYPVFLIPLALLLVFMIYGATYKDFFAYFHSGDNIHLYFPPFQIFNYSAPWVGTFWLEEVIFVYLFGAMGLVNLIKQKENILAWFVGVFFTTTIFISHRDIIRYSLPIIPFLYIAFKDTLERKEFKYVLLFLIIPIYLFSLAYISQNTMQISNWAPYL